MKQQPLLFCVAVFVGLFLIGLAGSHQNRRDVVGVGTKRTDTEALLCETKPWACQPGGNKECLPDSSPAVSGSDNLSKEEVLMIAEDVCRQERWERFWHGIKVEDEDSCWRVWTPFRLGSNILIRIDKKTGKVKEKYLTGP